MFDHIGFEVRDFNASKLFYDKVLSTLGISLKIYLEEYQAAGYGVERAQFWISQGSPTNGEDELHVCFKAKNRSEVRAFYEACLEAGGRDLGKPGLRPEYHEHYYGAFILDLDGHNIEACCHLPE
jgi:catechol 2,3-dioxygenase-like lactoylglutathione lyase family enzyme